ncbi:hypothetical protein E2C01_079392 [Portunus trituberculatus]|uniref:Uncharacterized protein n=1 Tax=Portunus trituberculatus TaxID=210409 RepID=A0A5B7IT92_PORTR|nr:hypothetical protein [Portunus trituberculatus]
MVRKGLIEYISYSFRHRFLSVSLEAKKEMAKSCLRLRPHRRVASRHLAAIPAPITAHAITRVALGYTRLHSTRLQIP